jgi:hypothetical protein
MATDDRNRTKCRHSGRENYSMTCHRCCGLRRQKSWASLDAVMKGDNLPNDTAGYSFSPMGARLVSDADIVRNIGCRPVPLVRSFSPGWGLSQF